MASQCTGGFLHGVAFIQSVRHSFKSSRASWQGEWHDVKKKLKLYRLFSISFESSLRGTSNNMYKMVVFNKVKGHSSLKKKTIISVLIPHLIYFIYFFFCQHLFDRLVDNIRSNNKLQSFNLLGHLVRKQPPWLHKIAQHSLLTQIFKVMKV